MSNVIQFPCKTRLQKGTPGDFTSYLIHLGATEAEIPTVLERLSGHFELVEQSFELGIAHSFPAPLTSEQLEAIGAALTAQADATSAQLKERNSHILLEFARLEYEILRKS
jgi:hypothetical protein